MSDASDATVGAPAPAAPVEPAGPALTGLSRRAAILLGVATAVVVGAGLVLGGNALLPSPEPGASVAATPDPSISPASPAPTVASTIGLGARPAREWDPEDPLGDFPFVRDDYSSPSGSDYSRFSRPATGETWHDPVEIPDPGNLLVPNTYWIDQMRYYSVGTRGDSDIVVAYAGEYYLHAFEIAPNGHGSLVPCFDAASGACESVDASFAFPHPDLAVRADIFYESLSLPPTYAMGATYSIALPEPGDDNTYWQGGGPFTLASASFDTNGGWSSPANATFDVIADLGGATIIEMTEDSALPGYRSLDYLVLTRLGRLGELASWSVTGGSPDLIAWDDGFGSGTPRDPFQIGGSVSPGTTVCQFYGDFAVDPHHDDSLWYAAGTTSDGLRVYLPTDDNPLPEQVRAVQMAGGMERLSDATPWASPLSFDRSRGVADRIHLDSADPYFYETDQAFRDARVLWSFMRPDGTWLIAMDPSGQADVYECS